MVTEGFLLVILFMKGFGEIFPLSSHLPSRKHMCTFYICSDLPVLAVHFWRWGRLFPYLLLQLLPVVLHKCRVFHALRMFWGGGSAGSVSWPLKLPGPFLGLAADSSVQSSARPTNFAWKYVARSGSGICNDLQLAASGKCKVCYMAWPTDWG